MSYEVRRAEKSDKIDIEALLERSFHESEIYPGYFIQLQNMLRHPEYIFVASDGVEAVGYIHGSEGCARVGLVEYLAVDSDWRKEGIGRSLIHRVAYQFSEGNFREVLLTPAVSSIPFYKKIGFYENGDGTMSASLADLL